VWYSRRIRLCCRQFKRKNVASRMGGYPCFIPIQLAEQFNVLLYAKYEVQLRRRNDGIECVALSQFGCGGCPKNPRGAGARERPEMPHRGCSATTCDLSDLAPIRTPCANRANSVDMQAGNRYRRPDFERRLVCRLNAKVGCGSGRNRKRRVGGYVASHVPLALQFPLFITYCKCNCCAEMTVLNAGRLARLGAGNVPKFLKDWCAGMPRNATK
jgi:hypothetical protein